MPQHFLYPSVMASPDYSTINESATPDVLPTNDSITQMQASHQYDVIERPEAPSNQCTTEQQGHLQEYSTIIRQESKKVTVKFTVSSPPQHHQNEANTGHPDRESNLTSLDETSKASNPPEANATINGETDPQVGAIYSTVVRQDGKKVTIRIQAPAVSDEHHTP